MAAPSVALPDLRGHGHAVIAVGRTGLRECEDDPAGTAAVNVAGTLRVAGLLLEAGVRPCAFSSDYVFDGRSGPYGDAGVPAPLNAYGRQKAELEARFPAEGLVVRAPKAYGTTRGDGTLLDEMFAALVAERTVRAARDQAFTPVHADDLAAATLDLLEAGAAGVVNVCGPDRITRFELGRRVAHAAGADARLVEEISLADLGEPFERPLDTSLAMERHRVRTRGIDDAIAELAAAYGVA